MTTTLNNKLQGKWRIYRRNEPYVGYDILINNNSNNRYQTPLLISQLFQGNVIDYGYQNQRYFIIIPTGTSFHEFSNNPYSYSVRNMKAIEEKNIALREAETIDDRLEIQSAICRLRHFDDSDVENLLSKKQNRVQLR